MSDRFTETTSQSWFSRIGESIKSVLIGLLMFVASFPLLFWNEGRAVRTARSLTQGSGSVVSVPADAVDPSHEGKLVHVTGPVTTSGPAADPELGVEAQGLKLVRKAEMYQWVESKKSETHKKLGGGEETVTTYEYKRDWSGDAVDSSAFKHPEGHENPGAFPVESQTFAAADPKVGAFTLAPEQIDQLNDGKDVPVGEEALANLPEELSDRAKISSGAFYLGDDPAAPKLGDTRISYQVVAPAVVSVIGAQTGQTFAPWQAEAGDTVFLVDEGTHAAAEMFQAAQSANAVMGWILRAVGFLLMFLGLALVFKPISVFADVVPLFGTMLGAGLGLFAFLIALFLSLVTIAIAWIAVRPMLAIGLLVLALAGLVLLVRRGRKQKAMRTAFVPPPPPPPQPVGAA
jgi:hypothetical protein